MPLHALLASLVTPGNLTTVTWYQPDGDWAGRVRAVLHPDGTASVTSWGWGPYGKWVTTTSSSGVPNDPANPTAITAGTRTVTEELVGTTF